MQVFPLEQHAACKPAYIMTTRQIEADSAEDDL